MAETVDLAAPDLPYRGTDALSGLLARPSGAGPWPGVVVLFEGTGPDAVNRRLNERMADAGYLALMPDLYHGRSPRRCMVSTMRSVGNSGSPAYRDIEAARRWLLAHPDCTGRIGMIGFCMGGNFALVAAGQGRYDAAVANYGRVPDDADTVMRDACPVLAHYGGRDKVLRPNAAKLEATLTRLGVEHDVKVYPDAGHSFLNDADNSPRALRPIMRFVMGIGPEPTAAADAWQRIDAFFTRHLTAG